MAAGDGGTADALEDLVLNVREDDTPLPPDSLQHTKRNRKQKRKLIETVQSPSQQLHKNGSNVEEKNRKRAQQESGEVTAASRQTDTEEFGDEEGSLVMYKKKKKRKKEVTSGEKVDEVPCEIQKDGKEDDGENGHDASKQRKKKKRLKVNASIALEEPELDEDAANFLNSETKRRRTKDENVHKEIDNVPHTEDHQHCNKKTKNKLNPSIPDHSTMTEKKGVPAACSHTISIAVAGSIIDNAQSLQLQTVLAGQIARAATIFRIDEIVVFDDDDDGANKPRIKSNMQDEDGLENGASFMVRILEYLEVPQYLRQALIPRHSSLQSVGRLPPLDAPHHLRKHEWFPYREGVVVDNIASSGSCSYVDVGLMKNVKINRSFEPKTRVTVAMDRTETENALQVVDREVVRQSGTYWGYRVRYASCLSAVFDECPYEGKYDYSIGTSEHGERIRPVEFAIPKFKHLLIAFGGLAGLEESLELDRRLKGHSTKSLFDRYLNTCPNQGSRTIRTEEAILISLQYLHEVIQPEMDAP